MIWMPLLKSANALFIICISYKYFRSRLQTWALLHRRKSNVKRNVQCKISFNNIFVKCRQCTKRCGNNKSDQQYLKVAIKKKNPTRWMSLYLSRIQIIFLQIRKRPIMLILTIYLNDDISDVQLTFCWILIMKYTYYDDYYYDSPYNEIRMNIEAGLQDIWTV